MAAQRSRQRKKSALDVLDKRVAALQRIQDELTQKNQRLLRERKERQQKLEQIKKHQIRLNKKVWASFMACKFATEELKKYVGLNRAAAETAKNSTIPERSFQTLMQGQYTNSLENTSNCATIDNNSSISNGVVSPRGVYSPVSPLLGSCRQENMFSEFFKQQQTTGMDSTIRWENLDSPIIF